MAEPENFQAVQYAFAAHIRDPQHAPAPEDVEDRRMAVYRELFFNNVRDLLARGFPVLRKILGESAWAALIRDFLVQHRCQTPLFLELPREFLAYLRDTRVASEADPPFLQELAHYEWVELALSIDEREPGDVAANPAGDMLDEAPIISPVAWPLVYAWPVHRISPDYQPEAPGDAPTCLVVFRGPDLGIGFLEVNPVTARLLELVSHADGTRSGRELLESIARELAHPNPDTVIGGGRDLLDDLRERGVLLGTRPV